MRWSLILSAFIAVQSVLSFLCVALAIPPSSDGLERREPVGPKLSSAEYRENAKSHPYAYHFKNLSPTGKMTPIATAKKEKLEKGKEKAHGEKLLKEGKKIHAGAFL